MLLPLWVWAEARSEQPLVDMRMMRIPTVWTTNLVSLLFGVGMYAMFAFVHSTPPAALGPRGRRPYRAERLSF